MIRSRCANCGQESDDLQEMTYERKHDSFPSSYETLEKGLLCPSCRDRHGLGKVALFFRWGILLVGAGVLLWVLLSYLLGRPLFWPR